MLKERYLNNLRNKLSYYYDIKTDVSINNTSFDLYAISNVKNSKYMGSKKVVIYSFSILEILQ